jgi:bifunctional non-homologous end joining protein LigD
MTDKDPLRASPKVPEWVEPMAATLTQERFTDPAWTFERKLDGIRLLAFKDGDDVRLFSRTRNPQHIPHIAAAIAALPVHDAILDGELTWDRSTGFHIFDILWIDGRDVTALPLTERRRILNRLELEAPLHRVPPLDVPAPWEHACAEGWEGVIAKRVDSPYEHKRSKHWLKMKCELTHDFVVGGFTDPQGGRKGLGALLVGFYDGQDFVFAGRVGTGFDTKLLIDLRARLDAAEIPKPPFTKATGLPRVRNHWVTPEIVVRAAFIEWTGNGKLRHSRLLGLVTDRKPRDVVRTDAT